MLVDLQSIRMLRAQRLCTCHIMQLYCIFLISPSVSTRLVLGVLAIRTVRRPLNLRLRALLTSNTTCSTPKATKQSIVNQLAYNRANRWGACSNDSDLNFDEGPYTRRGDADWQD
jgi:hypothetical protein